MAKHEATAQIDSVTDFVEEKQTNIDVKKTAQALQVLAKKTTEVADSDSLNSDCVISVSDTNVIMEALDLSKIEAERALRGVNGDPAASLRKLLRS